MSTGKLFFLGSVLFFAIFSLEGLTQTEAYLTGLGDGDLQKGWKVAEDKFVAGTWDVLDSKTFEKVKEFTIQRLIPIERKYAKDYYVFYHGQAAWFYAIQMLYRELFLKFKNLRAYHFAFLRRKADLYPHNEFVSQLLKESQHINDSNEPFKSILLSVNLSFPGSFQRGESTFLYFGRGRSWQAPSPKIIIDNIIEDFLPFIHYFKVLHLNTLVDGLQNKITEIFTNYKGPGCLLQIFIPKDEVEKYAYLSRPGGKPAVSPALPLKKILDDLNNPLLTRDKHFKKLQARLLLNENLYFGALQKNIKVIHHNDIPEEIRASLRKEIRNFVDHLFLSAQEKIGVREMIKMIPFISKALAKKKIQGGAKKISRGITRISQRFPLKNFSLRSREDVALAFWLTAWAHILGIRVFYILLQKMRT